jgi:cytidylate kinase
LAIVTISHQYGSRGETIAHEVAQRLGFFLVTSDKVDEVIRDRYQLNYSLSGEIDQTPRESQAGKFLANLISAILTDMAVLQDVVVLECGGQFIFRAFPNAMHVRVIAPEYVRANVVMKERRISLEQAIKEIEDSERRQLRFFRSTFRRPSDTPDRYDLILNTGSLESSHAVELILQAVNLKRLPEYGLVSSETVERARVRNHIRLARALSRLSMDRNESPTQFAHPSERLFARLLDFYHIRWQYEPRTFPLERDAGGNVVEAFSPDFYLPDSDLWVELTTMKQSLVTRKNRKVKRLRELYPDIKIRLLYQKDFEDLIFKYEARKPPGNPAPD